MDWLSGDVKEHTGVTLFGSNHRSHEGKRPAGVKLISCGRGESAEEDYLIASHSVYYNI